MIEYECLVVIKYDSSIKAPRRSLTVPVLTESRDKKTIKAKALVAASMYLKELGIEHDLKDLKPISFKSRGSEEVMPNETI